jgi:heparan sulfate 2-O-sulfotransferase HS2ST1
VLLLFAELPGASLLTASSTQSTAKAGASSPANVALAPKNLYDFDANLVVIYNRVPKTGSTSFVNLAYDLCKKNHFYVLHINVTANMHVLNLMNQVN